MEFRIVDTFTASLAKLDGQAQKQVKTTAFDLQLNPANPGMQFHRLNKSKARKPGSQRKPQRKTGSHIAHPRDWALRLREGAMARHLWLEFAARSVK